jgi:hypothetical protein
MPKSYDDLDALFADLEEEITNAMNDDVSDVVKDTLSKHVKKDVYKKYTPQQYDRDKDNGGLSDKRTMEHNMIDKTTLEVYSDRKNDPSDSREGYEPERDIAYIVETGEGYNWAGTDKQGRTNATPRPFVKNTIEDLDENEQHVKALQKSLKKKGYDVKVE